MNKMIFKTADALYNGDAAVTVYGSAHQLYSLSYAPNGYPDLVDFENVIVPCEQFAVRTGFEKPTCYDNLSEAVADFERRSNEKLNETSVLAAFKAYVVAEVFFVF